MKEEKIEIGILNEFWVAPSREDIKKMCNIFEPALSRFHISCETGNERVRSLNFPGKNTNKEYMRSIEEIDLHEAFLSEEDIYKNLEMFQLVPPPSM